MKNFKLALAGIATVVGVVGASATGVLAASSSANTTINATIESVISAGTDFGAGGTNPVTKTFNVTPGGGVGTSTVQSIRISTNAAAGYQLTIKDADANTNLVNGSNTIAAHTGTHAAPTPLANNTWGYRLSTYTANSYAGVTATDVQINSSSAPVTDHATDVTYGALVDSSKPSGTYTDVITFTATTN